MVASNTNREYHKKVLLRERKRHTARRIASARYVGGVYLIQSWWGYPRYPPTIQTWPGWIPLVPSRPGMGYPPTIKTWDRVPSPPSRPGIGYPPQHPDLGWGTPNHRPGMGYSPPPKVEQTHTCENIISRRTYVRGR